MSGAFDYTHHVVHGGFVIFVANVQQDLSEGKKKYEIQEQSTSDRQRRISIKNGVLCALTK